jgi:hypothetical protein
MNLGFNSEMSKEVQRALQAGFGMFQLVYPKKINFDDRIMGFFDVDVKEIDSEVGGLNSRAQLDINWRTGSDAYATFFRVNKEGLGVCWLPDDAFWHNRLCLMDNPSMIPMIRQLITGSGSVKDSIEVRMEIKCLEDELKESVSIWRIIKNGREIDFFWSKQEADEFANSLKSPELSTDGGNNIIVRGKSNSKVDIIEGKKLQYKKEIEKLKSEEMNRHRFGWTECDEFRKVILPRVAKRINDERAKLIAKSPDAFVIDPNELVKLRELAETMDKFKKAGVTPEKMAEMAQQIDRPGSPIKRFADKDKTTSVA